MKRESETREFEKSMRHKQKLKRIENRKMET